jgi:hypothetical protein
VLAGDVRIRATLLAAVVNAACAAGCAGHPWPDEPGLPVALSRAANVQAGDTFLSRLTEERRAANLPAPVVTPQHQDTVRTVAEDLQSGKLTAGDARRAIERLGSVWLVDCAAGEKMKLPSALVERPVAIISYAAAHFRPRSLASDQCAVLVVALEGGEQVQQQKL